MQILTIILLSAVILLLLPILLLTIKIKSNMSTKSDLDAAFAAITATITKLGTDLTAALAQIATPGLSQADLDSAVATAQGIATQLTSFDATVVSDTPTPPATS